MTCLSIENIIVTWMKYVGLLQTLIFWLRCSEEDSRIYLLDSELNFWTNKQKSILLIKICSTQHVGKELFFLYFSSTTVQHQCVHFFYSPDLIRVHIAYVCFLHIQLHLGKLFHSNNIGSTFLFSFLLRANMNSTVPILVYHICST